MTSSERAKQQWIAEAIKTLEREGYVVIPGNRVITLTVEKAISGVLLDMMDGKEEAERFQEYCDRQIGHEIGHGIQKEGGITKVSLGRDPDMHAYRWRYTANLILPKKD